LPGGTEEYHEKTCQPVTIMTLDGRIFYSTNADVIRQLLEVLLKKLKTRKDNWQEEKMEGIRTQKK
jgi:hypothetical protein